MVTTITIAEWRKIDVERKKGEEDEWSLVYQK